MTAIPAQSAYPSIEELVKDWLDVRFATAMVRTELPGGSDGVAPNVPLIRLARVGGVDVQRTLDRPIVDIEAFMLTRGGAVAFAARIQVALLNDLPGARFNGGYFQSVRTVSGPAWRPWDDLKVRRVGASYEFVLHTQ